LLNIIVGIEDVGMEVKLTIQEQDLKDLRFYVEMPNSSTPTHEKSPTKFVYDIDGPTSEV
jgi:hypothetical protein